MIKEPRQRAAKTPTKGAHIATEAPEVQAADPASGFAALFAPRRSRPTHRARTIASALLMLGFLGVLGFVIKSSFLSGIAAFPAVVQPAETTELDFQNMGTITAIDVYPGERVVAGQVIATQSTQLEQLRLAYDLSLIHI